MEKLDLSSLDKAVAQLRSGLAEHAALPSNSLMRDGAIQRFNCTYELSHKMLKRYLEATASNPTAIDELSFQSLIRTGHEQGVLQNSWDVWAAYRHARSITSHGYDENKALQVLAQIPAFLAEAEFLLKRLLERNAAP
jgi:nucleotidyltransferase substrate binding protein (TIGR01987 family)